MSEYSVKFKESLVKKVLQNPERSVSSIAVEAGVGKSTLHQWVKNSSCATINNGSESVSQRPKDWSNGEKLNALLESSKLSEHELGEYCRRVGLHTPQLETWKSELLKEKDIMQDKKLQNELKELRAENKMLKQDINRKDKALAETSALLVLKKKAGLIWGDIVED